MVFSIIDCLIETFYEESDKNFYYALNKKYTIGDYFNEIINVLKGTHSWRQYNGKINGRTLNNKHNEFIGLDIYKKAYKKCIEIYLSDNGMKKLKYQSIDTSFIQNKQCMSTLGRNKFYKNKKGIKVSTIVDSNGIPLSLLSINCATNDCITVNPTIDNFIVCVSAGKYRNHNRYKQYLLADRGYDSLSNRDYLNDLGYCPIISYNRRNTKNQSKLKHLTKKEKKIYKKRIIVENYFAWIKRYPKIDRLYEKTIESYDNLLYLASILIIMHKANNLFI